tara:strand:+ start:234 stop:1334 length:1101 start_codon:yes stop_codon:yes gene_type:complete
MNVLSLFNGMSFCAMALESLDIKVDKYYSSEIDKYANQAAQALYPGTIQLGDVTNWREWNIDWSSIDLVTGGFPCQAWSVAGKQLGDKDERGMLFWTMLDVMKRVKYHNPKADFLIENVKMKKEFEEYITTHTENALGDVHKILINSALVSAQNRNRYYWTSFEVEQPEDRGVVWGDVRENGVEFKPMYYSDKAIEWIGRHGSKNGKKLKVHGDLEKMQMLEASHYKKYSSQRFFGIVDTPSSIVGRRINNNGVRDDYNKGVPITQCLQVKHNQSKTGCLTTVIKDNVISCLPHGRYPDVFNRLEEGKHYRYITPRECFRLQTVPEDKIDILLNAGISNTQLYKMAGNGWTMEVIAHIFKGLKNAI